MSSGPDRFPIDQTQENRDRFNVGLVADFSTFLRDHGFPSGGELSPRDWVRLQQSLYRLLFTEKG
jgi:hypothetical protein